MISLAPGTKVFLACRPVDLRNGFDGLAAKTQQVIGADPFSGHVTNNGGNSSKFEVNHTRNFNGVNGASAGHIAQSKRSGNRQLHETLKSWHANGATKLPKR